MLQLVDECLDRNLVPVATELCNRVRESAQVRIHELGRMHFSQGLVRERRLREELRHEHRFQFVHGRRSKRSRASLRNALSDATNRLDADSVSMSASWREVVPALPVVVGITT
jgi:hypothetical protein